MKKSRQVCKNVISETLQIEVNYTTNNEEKAKITAFHCKERLEISVEGNDILVWEFRNKVDDTYFECDTVHAKIEELYDENGELITIVNTWFNPLQINYHYLFFLKLTNISTNSTLVYTNSLVYTNDRVIAV